MTTFYCPGCEKPITGRPALSRYDNSTTICAECGRLEALAPLAGYILTAPGQWRSPNPTPPWRGM